MELYIHLLIYLFLCTIYKPQKYCKTTIYIYSNNKFCIPVKYKNKSYILRMFEWNLNRHICPNILHCLFGRLYDLHLFLSCYIHAYVCTNIHKT